MTLRGPVATFFKQRAWVPDTKCRVTVVLHEPIQAFVGTTAKILQKMLLPQKNRAAVC